MNESWVAHSQHREPSLHRAIFDDIDEFRKVARRTALKQKTEH